MRKFYASLAALAVVVSGVLLFNFMGGESSAALPRDCDNNSIIYCGGITASELAQRYSENKPGDLDNIYSSYGLSATEMKNAGTMAKMGEVHKDGSVTVNGEVVATDVHSIGRQNIFSGSTKKVIDGKTYYDHVPSGTFARESIVAYVFFDGNGNFKAAVLTSCGNPVNGKPKPKPVYTCKSLTKTAISRTEYSFNASATASGGASIVSYNYDFGDGKKETSSAPTLKHTYAKEGTYTAKVTVNVKVNGQIKVVPGSGCQVVVTVSPPPATPVYTCDMLTGSRISRLEYNFNGKASATGGATIVNYVFDFGDGKSTTVDSPKDVKHTYEKEGTYNAKLSVTVKVKDAEKVVTDNVKCVFKVTVTPEECKPGIPVGDDRCTPCEVPGKEQYPKNAPECSTPPVTPPELPHTGPMDMIAGGIGLSSIVAAAYYWHVSRRNLLSELLNR